MTILESLQLNLYVLSCLLVDLLVRRVDIMYVDLNLEILVSLLIYADV